MLAMSGTTIFHSLNGYGMCFAPRYEPAPAGLTHPEHGTVVSCGVCGRYGIIPEEGHELEFLPPGTERTEDGGFILRPR
jgi:hypothetical protein